MIELDQFTGEFPLSYADFRDRRKQVKGIVLQWQGVMHDAQWHQNAKNTIDEIDAMGIDVFRFSHFLATRELLPMAILADEENEALIEFANREHLDTVVFQATNKKMAAERFARDHRIAFAELAWVYLDIMGFELAVEVALRLKVARAEAPLTRDYILQKNLVDYNTSAKYAIRECMELLMLHYENHIEAIEKRSIHSPEYRQYMEQKNLLATQYLIFRNKEIVDYTF